MDSASKNRKSPDVLRAMVRPWIGAKADNLAFTELTEGFFNVAYLLEGDGLQAIMKIAPPDTTEVMSYEKNIMATELACLRLTRHRTSVPVPQVYFAAEKGQYGCDAPFIITEKLPGQSMYTAKLSDEERADIMRTAGEWCRQLADVQGAYFGLPGQECLQDERWRDAFTLMLESVWHDGERKGVPLPKPYDEMRRVLRDALPTLDDVTKTSLVHNDMWAGNIFVQDGKAIGLIDWERALYGDPLLEYSFRMHCVNTDFFKGYGEDLRAAHPIRAYLYDIYLYSLMSIECSFRHYSEGNQYAWSMDLLARALDLLEKAL